MNTRTAQAPNGASVADVADGGAVVAYAGEVGMDSNNVFHSAPVSIRSNQSAQISVSPGMGLENGKISGM